LINNTNAAIDKVQSGKAVAALPFYLAVFSAIAIKLTSSIDDIVWLVPFLIVPSRPKVMTNVAIYIWVCLFQAVLALGISHGGMAAIDAISGKSGTSWTSEKILTFFAGVSLLGYGLKLAKEYYDENWGEGAGDDDDDGDDGKKAAGDDKDNVFSSEGEDSSTEESGLLIMTAEKREAMGQTEGYGLATGAAGGSSSLVGGGGGAAAAAREDKDKDSEKGQRTSSSLFIVRGHRAQHPKHARESPRSTDHGSRCAAMLVFVKRSCVRPVSRALAPFMLLARST
jgi:hypothetical protein